MMDLKGKTKKLLAILAAVGITASGTVDFLNHLMTAVPNPKLHAVCSAIITLIGLCVAIFPVSIKKPDEPKPVEPPPLPPPPKAGEQ